MHTILPPIQYEKWFYQRRSITSFNNNSVKDNFYKHKRDFEFEQRLSNRSYPTALVHKILTEVQFSDRTEALPNKTKKAKEIWPFATTDNPATPNHTTFRLATRSACHRASLTATQLSKQNLPLIIYSPLLRFHFQLLYFIFTKSAKKDAQRNIPYISPTYVESQLTNFAKLESGYVMCIFFTHHVAYLGHFR